MQLMGNAVAGGVYGDVRPSLPRPRSRPPAHRPWCADCKVKHEPQDLDAESLCSRCARAAVTRAAAAARRAAAEPPPAPRAPAKPARAPKTPRSAKNSRPAKVAPPRKPRAQPRSLEPRIPLLERRAQSDRLDVRAIIVEYRSGDTAPVIGRRHGIGPGRVRALLKHHGVELRDDRATHSGGRPRIHDARVVAEVARLYTEERLSRSQVADRLGIPYKTVVNIMRREGVPARQGQSGGRDGAAALKARMAGLGVTSAQIKHWSHARGLIPDASVRGIPAAALLEAYAKENS